MTAPINLDLGEILKAVELIATVGGFLIIVFKLGKATEKFESLGRKHSEEIERMQTTLEKLVDAQREQIQNTTRLDNQSTLLAEMRKEINDLRRGRGFISDVIDGEYPRR